MRIAITGGIAEGKSTVLAHLASLGYSTLSSDEIVRQLYRDPEFKSEVSRIASVDPEASSTQILEAIGRDQNLRRRVNRYIHPQVVAAHLSSDAVFHEIPLLYEVCLQKRFDFVWLVTCGERHQVERLKQRYGQNVDFDRLLSTQLSSKVKKAHADCEIRTDFDLDSVYHQLEIALGQFGVYSLRSS